MQILEVMLLSNGFEFQCESWILFFLFLSQLFLFWLYRFVSQIVPLRELLFYYFIHQSIYTLPPFLLLTYFNSRQTQIRFLFRFGFPEECLWGVKLVMHPNEIEYKFQKHFLLLLIEHEVINASG